MEFNLTSAELSARLSSLEEWKIDISKNLDHFFFITLGVLIYLMQAGFAFLEAGAVRSKNAINILLKNMLDSFFSGVSYWLFGYAFAYGDGNAFIGLSRFAHHDLPEWMISHWFFHFVFAATAATIVSGAVAERCEFVAYITYSCLITGFIYPVATHWAWSPEGWLGLGHTYLLDGQNVTVAYTDFSGSGVVHMTGGLAAYIGAWMLGPRIGRFDKKTGEPVEIEGHSVPLASLGGFILVFGFFAFNASALMSLSRPGDGAIIATAVKNTVLACCGGAFTTLILSKTRYFGDKKWNYMTTLNGCLTGMVAICGGCNQFPSYTAIAMGVIGGLAFKLFSKLALLCKIDDPLDAGAVHFGGGIFGVLSVPLLSPHNGIVYYGNMASLYFLGWQVLGMVAITAWAGALSLLMFGGLKLIGQLRVSIEYELKGLDLPKHGRSAYPEVAYGHGWSESNDSYQALYKAANLEVVHHTQNSDVATLTLLENETKSEGNGVNSV